MRTTWPFLWVIYTTVIAGCLHVYVFTYLTHIHINTVIFLFTTSYSPVPSPCYSSTKHLQKQPKSQSIRVTQYAHTALHLHSPKQWAAFPTTILFQVNTKFQLLHKSTLKSHKIIISIGKLLLIPLCSTILSELFYWSSAPQRIIKEKVWKMVVLNTLIILEQ